MEPRQATQITQNISSGFREFSEAILNDSPTPIHSIHVVGSALTPDFSAGTSDINSIVVMEEVTLAFMDFLVNLGKEYAKKNVAAPLLMTPRYIETSLDVFPIEFLNFQTIHHTLSGPDILRNLVINRNHLLLQCERETKSKLLWLHQGYIEALGDEQQLVERLRNSINGYMPLFRAILHLGDRRFPLTNLETAAAMEELIGVDNSIFKQIVQLRKTDKPLDRESLCTCFAAYYQASQLLNDYVEHLAA